MLLTLIGVLLGVTVVFMLGLTKTRKFWLPVLAQWLENDPNNPKGFSCTTKVGPGDQKFITVGGKVVRSIMNYPGHKHAGGTKVPDCYEVVPLADGEVTPPIEFINWIDELLYRETGYRLIIPFREHVFVYMFPRAKELVDEKGVRGLIHKETASDHFILAEQTHFFEFADLETGLGENVKVTFPGRVTVQIVNPYKTAYHDEKWLLQNLAAMQVRAKDFARARDFDTLLGESKHEGDEIVDQLGLDLMKINSVVAGQPNGAKQIWGVEVKRVLMGSPVMTDPEAEKKRTAKYGAMKDAEVVGIGATAEAARRITIRAADATAEVGYLNKVSAEVKRQGLVGVKLLDQQVELAYASKAGTVIRNSGGIAVDPINAQILEEMKKQNSASGGHQPKARG